MNLYYLAASFFSSFGPFHDLELMRPPSAPGQPAAVFHALVEFQTREPVDKLFANVPPPAQPGMKPSIQLNVLNMCNVVVQRCENATVQQLREQNKKTSQQQQHPQQQQQQFAGTTSSSAASAAASSAPVVLSQEDHLKQALDSEQEFSALVTSIQSAYFSSEKKELVRAYCSTHYLTAHQARLILDLFTIALEKKEILVKHMSDKIAELNKLDEEVLGTFDFELDKTIVKDMMIQQKKKL